MAALFTALLVFLRVTTAYSENCPSWLEFCKGEQDGKRVCYAIPNGDCPDAGSTTECKNPSKPGPWTCAWCTCPDDFGTPKVIQARYDISSGGGDKKEEKSAEPNSNFAFCGCNGKCTTSWGTGDFCGGIDKLNQDCGLTASRHQLHSGEACSQVCETLTEQSGPKGNPSSDLFSCEGTFSATA